MSLSESPIGRLDRAVDAATDHILGPHDAPITLVEYGSYACPHCRAANDRIAEVRTQFGDRLRYVFRHLPLSGSDLARRAAELAESAPDTEAFWRAHVVLMTRSERLTEDDLRVVAEDLGLELQSVTGRAATSGRAAARVAADIASARASGVRYTPAFYINDIRYDGPWDESSFTDALLGSLGHRVRTAALQFASWAPSTGTLLLLATLAAIVLANTAPGPQIEAFWRSAAGVVVGDAVFRMPVRDWINDGLLTLFFLVVGLEIKREFTVGSLASRRSAALPIAAAAGGMAGPVLLFAILIPSGPWSLGWGVPMATDTAFAIALIAMMGRRVPVELRVFLTAAAIVDDIGAIAVVTLVYSADLHREYLALGGVVIALLWVLNRSSVYRTSPYLLLGVALWACIQGGGLHATLAGVILAAFIPTRPPPNYRTLAMQADAILRAEAGHGGEQLRTGPSAPALRALDEIHDRLESPAERLLRMAGPRASYLVLPVFALANAGVIISPDVFDARGVLMLAIMAGLVIGKPLGFAAGAALAVWFGLAHKPATYSWRQLAGAGALAGIGFTMSLFIAGQAFPLTADFSAARIAVFSGSVLSAAVGVAVLWRANVPRDVPGGRAAAPVSSGLPRRVTPLAAAPPISSAAPWSAAPAQAASARSRTGAAARPRHCPTGWASIAL
jgi:Na+:H+ antiporter, NhaA family